MLDVNLTGAFLGCRAAADAMIASGGGSIINTSSIEGLRGTPSEFTVDGGAVCTSRPTPDEAGPPGRHT